MTHACIRANSAAVMVVHQPAWQTVRQSVGGPVAARVPRGVELAAFQRVQVDLGHTLMQQLVCRHGLLPRDR